MKQKLLMLAMMCMVFALGVQAQDDKLVTVLDENFDAFTEGSVDAPATVDISSYSSSKLNKTLSGWSGSKVYEAGGALKIDKSGRIQTAALSKSVRGQAAKITVRLKALYEFGALVKFSVGYNSIQDAILLEDDEWHTVVVYTDLFTLSSKLTIEPYMMEGFLIDDLKIETSPTFAVPPIASLPDQADGESFTAYWKHNSSNTVYLLDVYSYAANGDKEYVLHDEEVKPLSTLSPSVTKKVTGLNPEKTYYYTVRGRNKDGYTSDYSEEIKVCLVLDDVDAPEATAATNVSSKGFTANWNAVEHAVRYAVTLECTETLKDATSMKVIDEDFSKVKIGTLESVELGKTQESLDAYTQASGWWGKAHAYAAGYLVLAPYSGAATLTTPKMDYTANDGKFTLNIKMAEGNYGFYYAGGTLTVKLYDDDPNVEDANLTPIETKTITIDKNTFADYSVEFTKGAATSYIEMSYSGSRKLFFDEISVVQELKAGDKWTHTIQAVETEDTHYDFVLTNPKAEALYTYHVNAIAETVESHELVEFYSANSNSINVNLSIESGINDVANGADVQIAAQGGVITISLPTASRIAVYDLSGRLLASLGGKAGANHVPVASGQVVLVKTAGKTVKLAL